MHAQTENIQSRVEVHERTHRAGHFIPRRKPANKADAALFWCGTPIGWDTLTGSVGQGSQTARDSHPSCYAPVELEATVSGSQYQSAVAGGYQTFDVNV